MLYQDEAVVDTVRPELLPFDLSDELHVKSDYNQVLYRRRRQELIEMGWSVEGNTIVGEGTSARVEARVIPSPARKEVPELASAWNFKEVRSRQLLESEAARRAPTSVPLTQATPDVEPDEPESDRPIDGGHGMSAACPAASATGTLDAIVEARRPHRGRRSARSASSTSPMSPDPVGTVRIFRGDGAVAKVVYVGLARARRSAWTATWSSRSPAATASVPHFTLDSVQGQGSYAFHLDLIPRAELATHLSYVDWAHTPLDRDVRRGRGPPGPDARPRSARASTR